MHPSFLSRSLWAIALLGLAACNANKVAPDDTGGSLVSAAATVDLSFEVNDPTSSDRELDPDASACDTAATLVLPLGLTKFATVEETAAALHGTVLLPDPATLPEDSTFHEAYYNATMQGQFKQSTIGVTYFSPAAEPGDPPNEIAVLMYNSAFKEYPPTWPAQEIRIRGYTAYGANVPFEEGLHSVGWYDGCRYHSVISKLPAKDIVRIAEGLMLAPERQDASSETAPAASATTPR